MVASFIITLRETLEAALVIGIVISLLKRTNQQLYYRMVYYGVAIGIASSVLGAVLFQRLAGGFSGRAEELFEGLTMIVGGFLITTLIIWVMRGHNPNQKIKDKVNAHVYNARPLSIFFMVWVAILREGIETVIFLQSASIASGTSNLWPAISGVLVAVFLGVVIYFGLIKINLKNLFLTTNILLMLFAAGLISHGVHELQEADIFPVIVEHLWDINPTVVVEGTYPWLHESGYIGSFLKGLFGYNGNPNLIEVIVYILYIVVIAYLWRFYNKRNRTSSV